MYRYTSVRIRVLGMGAEHPYTCGILIQELEEGAYRGDFVYPACLTG